MESIKKFLADESGVTSVEYGLMVALIAGVIITAVYAVGTNLSNLFDNTATTLSNHPLTPQ
jgi:pilus assembly protein Flp/PilA